jgi:quinol monooxygenase YgiN
MRDEIYWVFTAAVKPGRFAEFKQLVESIVEATRQEPGALAYEYNVTDDESTVHIFERYRDRSAIVTHVTQTFAPFGERFMALVEGTGFFVYGSPDAEARKILDGLGAVYMAPFAGFIR